MRIHQAIPIPPPRLRHRVHGGLDLQSFLTTGKRNYSDLINIIESKSPASHSELKILDFGCGCARTLRHFLREKPEWTYTATDIDNEAIEWNSRYLPDHVVSSLNNHNPPLPYPDKSFDVILAVSVFTHLDERSQFDWLREFSRILDSSGLVIASTHGKAVWESSEEWTQKLSDNGFLFLRTNTGIRNFANTPPHYQTTLHSKAYIEKHWSKHFGEIQIIERGINGIQDAVILRRPQID